jgi:DNA-binding NtrC family response regulator
MRVPEKLSFLAARRGLVPRLASTGYVVAVAMRAEGGVGVRVWGLGSAALALSGVSSRFEPRPSSVALWGASIVLASLGVSQATPWMDALGIVGVLIASIAACAALGRMSDRAELTPTLVPSRNRTRGPAIGTLLIGWLVALAATVGSAIEPLPEQDWMAAHAPLFTAFAAAVGAGVVLASCVATLHDRRFLLGVADRTRVARAIVLASVAGSAVACLLGRGHERVDHVLFFGSASMAALVAVVALHGDAVRIVRGWRRACVLCIVGGPIVMIAAMAADGRAPAVFVGTAVALVVGSFAPQLDGPLRPAEGAWLEALEHARSALARADAEAALRAALEALRAPAGAAATSPELWTLDPMRVLTIDAAGYAHERPGELPVGILDIASKEPEATLRTEVLEALEVRRPDLRRLSRWMADHGALTLTVIAAGGEALGALVIPRGGRAAYVTLEEARAMKAFADTLAATCEARSALARGLAREQETTRRAEAAEDRVLVLEQARTIDVGRYELAAARVARPAAVGVYSAPSRLAFEALERRIKAGAPVAIVAPSGVDPVPYVARAHLGGPRREAPLVIVDGTSSREHDPARWTDKAASPLALADRGTLLLVDGPSLPVDVQRIIARALAERRLPWERADPLDIALALSATAPLGALAAEGRLDPTLAARLADALEEPIVLPRLSERPEDIRAIITDRLAREGLRVRGAPVGIEDAAFARLAQYDFPGEDAELVSIVQRLVGRLRGQVVRAPDVDALGLGNARSEPYAGGGPIRSAVGEAK